MGETASKRAFARTIVESDSFLDMSATAQLLYFHLNMNADNDGVVNTPKQVMRSTRAHDGDMRTLIEEKLVVLTQDGKLVVITDWLLHNNLRFGEGRYSHGRYYDIAQSLLMEASRSTPGELPDKTTIKSNNEYKQQHIEDDIVIISENEIFQRLTSAPWYITARRARRLIMIVAERCAAFEVWAQKKRSRGEKIGAGLLINMIENLAEPMPEAELKEAEQKKKKLKAAQNAMEEDHKKMETEKAMEPFFVDAVSRHFGKL